MFMCESVLRLDFCFKSALNLKLIWCSPMNWVSSLTLVHQTNPVFIFLYDDRVRPSITDSGYFTLWSSEADWRSLDVWYNWLYSAVMIDELKGRAVITIHIVWLWYSDGFKYFTNFYKNYFYIIFYSLAIVRFCIISVLISLFLF